MTTINPSLRRIGSEATAIIQEALNSRLSSSRIVPIAIELLLRGSAV